jgi:hypothetical protein
VINAQDYSYRYCHPRYHTWSVVPSYELELRPGNVPLHIMNLDASFNRKWFHVSSGVGFFKDWDVASSTLVEYMQFVLIRHEILDTTYTTPDGDKISYYHEILEWDSVPGCKVVDNLAEYTLMKIPLYFDFDVVNSTYFKADIQLGGSFLLIIKTRMNGQIGIENATILNQTLLSYSIRDYRTNFQLFSGCRLQIPITHSLSAMSSYRFIFLWRHWYAEMKQPAFSHSLNIGLILTF